ncbi:MAG: MFS transporter, partial [Chloroflexota bacterium]|nr:MFS transporter [Chloroflexota bacterium]
LGLAGVYSVMALMNAAALTSLVRLRRHQVAAASGQRVVARGGSWAHMAEGLRYVASAPLLRTLLLMGLFPVLFTLPLSALLPILVARVYESGPGVLGVLSACLGLGALGGSIVGAGLATHKRPVEIQLAIGVGLGSGLVALALAPTYWLAAPMVAVIGFCQLLYMVLNNGQIIALADARMHGRVTSVSMLRFSMSPMAILAATWQADVIGPRSTVLLGGAVTIAGMVLFRGLTRTRKSS